MDDQRHAQDTVVRRVRRRHLDVVSLDDLRARRRAEDAQLDLPDPDEPEPPEAA